MSPLQLGVARADITPEIGTHLYGYYPFIVATEIHDSLTATAFCFVFENSSHTPKSSEYKSFIVLIWVI